MRVLIAGDGKVGLTLTRKLSSEGYDITLIDSNQSVLDASIETYDVMAVQGNCASMEVLKQAEVKKADLLIAATSADEINLLCCMTAHGMNPKIHTIARIRNPEYSEQIYNMRKIFNLSLAVNPEKQAAVEIERLLKFPGFLRRDTFAKGRVEIVELRVDSSSKLCDRALNDLDSIVKCKVLVCAVRRDGETFTPGGDFVLRSGDRIFVTAPTNNLTMLLKNLNILTHKTKRVMLCGGGRVSYYLAELLQKSGIQVCLIEADRERCIHLANMLPHVTVIHGDASSQSLLEDEGLADCDALVTMTGLDELNMIISLYGQRSGVPQVITKVSHTEHNNVMDSLALGSTVCPRDLCCNTIIRYVRAIQNQSGAALAVHMIADDQAEALEFLVDDQTMHCGEPLKNVKIRKGVLIACISRGSDTEIPNGDSCFREGDTLIVVSAKDVVIPKLNDIFE